MTKKFHGCVLCAFVFILFCCGGKSTPPRIAEGVSLLAEPEEYAVFTAVLFPIDQDVVDPTIKTDLERKAYDESHRVHLEGITGNTYSLNRLTIQGSKTDKDSVDRDIIADYNFRNARVYRIDERKLLPLVPEGCTIVLVTHGESRMTAEGIMPSGGITTISRPGFNKEMTRAIVQINHVADPEMGVGYEVYLEKSSSNAPWMITGSILNRRY